MSVAACGSDSDDGDSGGDGGPIKIGEVLSLSGVIAAYDEGVEWGAQQAIDEINADGGVDGRQLENIVKDNKSDGPLAANQTIELIEEDGVDAIISPCVFDYGGSTSSLEASSRNVLTISGCATAPIPPDASGGLHFDIGPSAFSEGAAMAEYAMDQGYEHPITVEDTTSLYFQQVTRAFEERYKELGGEVVDHLTMEFDQQSFASQISQIQEASPAPDVIYLGTYMPAASKFEREARAAGVDLPILGTEDWDGESWKSDASVNGVAFTAVASLYGDDPEEKINELIKQYREDKGDLPATSVGVLGGYRAVQAIAQAIEDSGGSTDGAELTATMEGWEDVALLGGAVSFSEDLHVPLVGEERLMFIDDNKTTFAKVLKAENVPTPGE